MEEISQIIRYASDAILLTDLSGKFLMVNEGAEKLIRDLSGGQKIPSLGALPQLGELLSRVRAGGSCKSDLLTVGETMFLYSQHPIVFPD